MAMTAGIVTMSTIFARPCTQACPHAESIILSALPAESMMLSVHAESIILSALPAESMILSAQPAESMIPLSACADTLGACQEQHTEGHDDDKYAKGDNNNEHLDDNNDNEFYHTIITTKPLFHYNGLVVLSYDSKKCGPRFSSHHRFKSLREPRFK